MCIRDSAGYVLAGNKQFRLTQKGLQRAAELSGTKVESKKKSGLQRLSRDREMELQRIYQTEAFNLFRSDRKESILDTDFYAYLGVTVRTPRNDFLGRLSTVRDAVIGGARILQEPMSATALELHKFLESRFSGLIEQVKRAK